MIYVMSDIHGCEARYRDILKQIHLTSEDHLYNLRNEKDPVVHMRWGLYGSRLLSVSKRFLRLRLLEKQKHGILQMV